MGKHLKFYVKCMQAGKMPYWGLCACAFVNKINNVDLFKPVIGDKVANKVYWGSGSAKSRYFEFTPLRQNIVLFMAAMNNEL